jgi:hypothetical protein
MHQLLILGAGVFGQRIAALVTRLIPHVEIVLAAHRARPGILAVDIHDPQSLRGALVGMRAVINTVGPFDYDPVPLVTTCLAAGCDYLDLAEAPAFVAAAQRAVPPGCTARGISGCSTMPGLVQVLVQEWAERDGVVAVRVFLGMGSANPVSPAMLFSFLRPLGRPAPHGSAYFDGLQRKAHRGTTARLYGRYPSPFDADDLRIGGRLVPATFHAGLDRPALSRVLWLAARALPDLPSAVLKPLCRLSQLAMPFVRRQGTTLGILTLEALDDRGRIVAEIEVRARHRGLDVPALPAVWAVRRFLERETTLPTGMLTLDQLFTPQQVAGWLVEEGFQVIGVLGKH